MRNNRRGDIATVVVVVLSLVGLTQLVPNWRPQNWFKPTPPTKELVAAQTAAAAAEAQAKALQARLDAIKAQDEAKKAEQLAYTHEMVTGAIDSNSKAPDSVEKAITDSLLQRADIGFNVAIGKLDPSLRDEVIGIVAQLRSGDQEKIKAANAMLAEKDRELASETAARVKIEKDAAIVKAERDKAVTEAAKANAKVVPLVAKVVDYANQKRAEEVKSGSLETLVQNLLYVLAFLAVIALGIGALYTYHRLRSVGPVTLGNILADIRSGVNATTAFDTHLNASLHPLVSKASTAATAQPTP